MKKYRDHYFKKAKQDSYPARSVYKLQEMDQKFGIFAPGQKILDLGASPGSWSIYASKQIGSDGKVVAVDKQEPAVQLPQQVVFLQKDILEPSQDIDKYLQEVAPYDVLLSDIAPDITGIKERDQARSLELARRALELGQKYLAPGGILIVKIFTSPEMQDLVSELKDMFARVKTWKPKSSRSESKENFLLGFGFKKR